MFQSTSLSYNSGAMKYFTQTLVNFNCSFTMMQSLAEPRAAQNGAQEILSLGQNSAFFKRHALEQVSEPFSATKKTNEFKFLIKNYLVILI